MAHILVIDDDDSLREVLVKFLEQGGHMVSHAANGRDGLHELHHKKADLVITDIFMPETDGLEVILAIKKSFPKASERVPVIAMSGGLETNDAEPISFLKQARLFGADRVFPKPLDFKAMLSAIHELLPAASKG
jgi:CheY-like chemotaxis protein